MNLRKLINGLKLISYQGTLEREISNIKYDSRECEKNSMFVAIRGYDTNGHNYIHASIKKGASVILYELELHEKEPNITYIQVEDSRLALAVLANNFYDNPSEKINLIGVTGTNGKTSVTFLINEIFHQWNKEIGIIGTIGNYLGDAFYEANHTTPESIDLQQILSQMLTKGIKYTVMEVSSHSLFLKRVEGTKYNIGIFTNLSQDHLDFHKTLENYFHTKAKFFYMTNKANIINGDDPYGQRILNMIKDRKVTTYSFGIENSCDFIARNINIDDNGVFFTFEGENIKEKFYINIPGIFSVYNAMAAIIVGYIEKIPMKVIKKALKRVAAVPGRFEVVDTKTSYRVIIDYAHTPDGLENVLKTIRTFSKKRVILVFGCGGDRDKGKRPIMGEMGGRYSDFCIITADNPRSEDPLLIIEDIIPGIKGTDCPYRVVENRREAIKAALAMGEKDDIILIAGKGHETYQILKDRTIKFNEKIIIKEILGEDEKNATDDNQ